MYKITSEYVKIENDKIITDDKGLRNFLAWEFDEAIINNQDEDTIQYAREWEIKKQRCLNEEMSIDECLRHLKEFDYNVEIV